MSENKRERECVRGKRENIKKKKIEMTVEMKNKNTDVKFAKGALKYRTHHYTREIKESKYYDRLT